MGRESNSKPKPKKSLSTASKEKSLVQEVKKRAEGNRFIRQEDLRERLSGKRIIDKLQTIVDEMTLMDQKLKKVRHSKRRPEKVSRLITRCNARNGILSSQASILFKKLNKILPDLKTTEVKGTVNVNTKPDAMPDEILQQIAEGLISEEEVIAKYPQLEKMVEEFRTMPDVANMGKPH